MTTSTDVKIPGRCPSCNGRALRRRINSIIFCYNCGDAEISPADIVPDYGPLAPWGRSKETKAEKQPSNGSGVIAGPCYARGYRWPSLGLRRGRGAG